MVVGCYNYLVCQVGDGAYAPRVYALMSFKLNGVTNYIGLTQPINNTFPIWLPAGSTIEASTNLGYLSIIEFNIIP